ncbi:hypothetical protein A3F19_02865 [Candidatus Nomurabacteria bacterium RIFCSPHIGHO2_12_FULL_37_29]|uniref:Uncharacterized protein n=1 Tax=Candidatus Nomurabacteria bacterium RIFCSPHIGHO2_12_FULL_37_29 TaxID=1801759 RepID=A0A1F6WBP9_9BACT|nr:MAG: hypothetical protein A3F19_02865 [Candidatus Nomurabacteria bacterium RIFCSPHIGHO2_12_FULL_37_29]OGI84380.1 MAG: hypothetical protein A3A92_01700 [Candidatus Nomurabacteria bacterium RIFCSPLOWO2_01_FULL_37_49]
MIKFFKKEQNFKKESLWLNINFYWKLFVCIIFITIILASFFGYYFFMQINKEFTPIVDDDGGRAETIKKERIEKVLEYFSLRKQKSSQILKSPSSIVDPSL